MGRPLLSPDVLAHAPRVAAWVRRAPSSDSTRQDRLMTGLASIESLRCTTKIWSTRIGSSGAPRESREAWIQGRTIVILDSDYGEAFREHGRMLHSPQLYEPMLRVSLIVDVPGVDSGVRNSPIQFADLGQGVRAISRSESEGRSGLTWLGQERSAAEPLYSWMDLQRHLVSVRPPPAQARRRCPDIRRRRLSRPDC